jgi:hypothetical protein
LQWIRAHENLLSTVRNFGYTPALGGDTGLFLGKLIFCLAAWIGYPPFGGICESVLAPIGEQEQVGRVDQAPGDVLLGYG